jgi:hypothetical protein
MGENALPEFQVGVLLDESTALPREGGPAGHTEARGYRGDHAAGRDSRVTKLGQDVLQAAARAVGSEVAMVLAGVVAGIESPGSGAAFSTGSFTIDSLELTFGVKATLGAGQAVAALLTAAGEATVDVKLTLTSKHAIPPG